MVLDQNQRSRHEILEAFLDDRRESLVYCSGPFVREPKDHNTWPVQNTERKNLAKVEVESQNNAGISPSAVDDLAIRRALHAEDANVGRLVAKPNKELDRPWRNPGIGKKSHSLQECKGWS